jgi:hypothetical protein
MPPTGPLARSPPAAHHPHALVLGPQPGLRARSGVVEAEAPPRREVVPERTLSRVRATSKVVLWVRASETQVARASGDKETRKGSVAPFAFRKPGGAAGVAAHASSHLQKSRGDGSRAAPAPQPPMVSGWMSSASWKATRGCNRIREAVLDSREQGLLERRSVLRLFLSCCGKPKSRARRAPCRRRVLQPSDCEIGKEPGDSLTGSCPLGLSAFHDRTRGSPGHRTFARPPPRTSTAIRRAPRLHGERHASLPCPSQAAASFGADWFVPVVSSEVRRQGDPLPAPAPRRGHPLDSRATSSRGRARVSLSWRGSP